MDIINASGKREQFMKKLNYFFTVNLIHPPQPKTIEQTE
jgi:hypothetical protein